MTLLQNEVAQLERDLDHIEVLPNVSASEYLSVCRQRHPKLYQRLNPARVSPEHVARLYAGIAELSTHFESKLEKGRGDSYRQAQNSNYLIRAVGFLDLYDLAVPQRGSAASQLVVLDALGGNGTLTRIVRASRAAEETAYIITSDVSARMIESALAQNLPAIRQPLQDLIWFDDCTFDSVIVAYGTHHIPPAQRLGALAEAYRVLKPGGRVVLQDFEIGCPTTKWYSDVLDRYTSTGHKYDYFTRQDFNDFLSGNRFMDVKVFSAYDPFIHYADDPNAARVELLEYLFTLFALEKLVPEGQTPSSKTWDELEAIVRDTAAFDPDQLPAGHRTVAEFTISRDGARYRAEIPRLALVATGRRPQ